MEERIAEAKKGGYVAGLAWHGEPWVWKWRGWRVWPQEVALLSAPTSFKPVCRLNLARSFFQETNVVLKEQFIKKWCAHPLALLNLYTVCFSREKNLSATIVFTDDVSVKFQKSQIWKIKFKDKILVSEYEHLRASLRVPWMLGL